MKNAITMLKIVQNGNKNVKRFSFYQNYNSFQTYVN